MHITSRNTRLLRLVLSKCDVECIERAKNTSFNPDRRGRITKPDCLPEGNCICYKDGKT